jgi:4-hydroxy-3-methylbut-2-enyl diphosphate reductase
MVRPGRFIERDVPAATDAPGPGVMGAIVAKARNALDNPGPFRNPSNWAGSSERRGFSIGFRPGSGGLPPTEGGPARLLSGQYGTKIPDALWNPSQQTPVRTDMRVILAQPRGFCAGVVRAIEIVERALQAFGPPVYVRHEIVHNRHVVESLKAKGAHFVEDLSGVPSGAVTIFSAHGVARAVEEEAERRGLNVIDATCPLVSKVHNQANRYVRDARQLILIGHAGHPEVEGTTGRIPGPVHLVQTEADVAKLAIPPDAPVAYVTQTTLSVDDTRGIIAAIEAKFSDVVGPDTRDICYATQNRQSAVRDLCKVIDVLLVVGASNSSNSNRLREIGADSGIPSYLIADGGELRPEWVAGAATVGITAGASAPETLVENVIDALAQLGPVDISTMAGRIERIEFKLPASLADTSPPKLATA